MLYFGNANGRVCIFSPFYGEVIAGSTDIPVSDPETAFCKEDEVGYILKWPIGGGKGYLTTVAEKSAWLASLEERTHLPMQRLEVLLDRYGTRAEDVAQFVTAAPDRPLRSLPEYTQRGIQ
jgi:glycerol-3-phosphate dehydrogenase